MTTGVSAEAEKDTSSCRVTPAVPETPFDEKKVREWHEKEKERAKKMFVPETLFLGGWQGELPVDSIYYCADCHCMTYTLNGLCGKCGKAKGKVKP